MTINRYYIDHSTFSNPHDYFSLYHALSNEMTILVSQIQQLFLHYADIHLYSVAETENQYHELNYRYCDRILSALIAKDNHDLSINRDPHHRIMGVCRDTALLLCSVLRSRGIAARLRSGFVTYFIPGLYLDGYAVEYYDFAKKRWCSVDARTMPIHIGHYQLNIDFDLMDVPSDKFISAGHAWKMCRDGKADPIRFGSRQHRGLFTVRNRLIQDLALLNKTETLIWDVWGPMLNSVVMDFDLLDELAELLINQVNNTENIHSFYKENSTFQVPSKILVDNPFLSPEWISLC